MSTASAPPSLPDGRYGRPRRPSRRWRVWVFTGIALVVSCAVAWIGYVNLGAAPISAERVTFAELPGNAMTISLNVTRDEPDRPGVCIVRTRDISGAESGRREVYIPANDSRVDVVVRSIDRPVTADVYGCSYDIPEYLSRS
ncbi:MULTISPECIES: DUF4307 domain-containing protein [Amycolatopsis]|uniref:DUF4307 domain-containing protein n=1 Tax=Amycolatopsis tucumanensis TaxID=401106 RepID=A0ABP7IMU5_9PSEU|nr:MULTISPECIES: DUF4307 domain-containing protein [Amycolatopsis]MCF6422824.1 DUF4307 domain-containing protein [Amycolatopsis tucumanensis]